MADVAFSVTGSITDYEELARLARRQYHIAKSVEYLRSREPKLARHMFIVTALDYFDKIRKDERLWR